MSREAMGLKSLSKEGVRIGFFGPVLSRQTAAGAMKSA